MQVYYYYCCSFFVDFDLFDDEKFKEVCSFVKHHLFMMKGILHYQILVIILLLS